MNEIIAIIARSFRAIIIIHNCATISLITPRESLARVQVRRGGIPKVAISTNETLFYYIFHYFPSYYISLAGSFLKFISTITISNSQPSSKIHNKTLPRFYFFFAFGISSQLRFEDQISKGESRISLESAHGTTGASILFFPNNPPNDKINDHDHDDEGNVGERCRCTMLVSRMIDGNGRKKKKERKRRG